MAKQTKMEVDVLHKATKLPVKFRGFGERTRAQQKFDTDSIYIEKAGQHINMQEFINANNEDAELIPTLEKYKCIDKIVKQDPSELNFGEENQNLNLMDAMNIMDKAREVWNGLNHATRAYYHNDVREFIKNFEKDRAKAIQQKLDFENKQKELEKANKEKMEVTNNGKQSDK